MPGDMCLAGILGTALAISSDLTAEAAVALATPLGLIGTILWVGRLTISTVFVRMADKMVERGETNRIWIADFLLPQLLLFAMTAIPMFAACYLGVQYVAPLIQSLSGTVLTVLTVIGGMMPAVGIAITLKFIFKGNARIFFFLGFIIAAFSGLSMIATGLIAICAAVIYTQATSNGDGQEGLMQHE